MLNLIAIKATKYQLMIELGTRILFSQYYIRKLFTRMFFHRKSNFKDIQLKDSVKLIEVFSITLLKVLERLLTTKRKVFALWVNAYSKSTIQGSAFRNVSNI